MNQSTHRIRRGEAALLVVDIQEKLFPSIFEKERVLENALRLVKGAALLKLPTFVTEQYRKGLGGTLPELAAVIPGVAPLEKLAFSSCGAQGLLPALEEQQLRDILVCGIESHVCVSQTCLDLLDRGLRPFVVVDAISSRTSENYQIGIDRVRAAGAVIVSTEMILFELLHQAGTAEFKQLLPLLR